MYSIVLMTAITTSTVTPTFGGFYGGCYGYGCAGNCGYAPHGFYSGYANYGAYAPHGTYGGYGGYGSYAANGSYGGYNGYGACATSGSFGAYGGYACGPVGRVPHYGGHGFAYGYHGGCYGAYGNWQGGVPFGGHGGLNGQAIPLPSPETRVAPVHPFPPVNPRVKDEPMVFPGGKNEPEIGAPPEKKAPIPETRVAPVEPFPPVNPRVKDEPRVVPGGKNEPEFGAPPEKKAPIKELVFPAPKPEEQVRVKVRIELPQDARLFVEGVAMPGTGARVFQTPPLTTGQKYLYVLRVEINRNGQVVSEQRRLIVEPGRDLAVSFPNLAPNGTATAKAKQ